MLKLRALQLFYVLNVKFKKIILVINIFRRINLKKFIRQIMFLRFPRGLNQRGENIETFLER